MTTRTCCVCVGAGGILAAGLAGGLAAYLQGGLPAAAAQGRPDQFRYIPADAHLVAFADVRAVMRSDLRERMRERQPEGDPSDFESRTGIDAGRDIDEVVAGLVPDAADAAGVLVVASGRFDRERLESLAVEGGGTVSDYAGHRMLVLAAGESRLAMAFVEPGVVALGSESLVREAIDLAAGGDGVASNERLMTLLAAVDPASDAWAVGELDRPGAGAWMPDGLDAEVLRVTAFSVAGQVNGGIRLTARAETPDDVASQNLRDILQGFLALARMQADREPEVAGILDSVRLRAPPGERFVSLSMTVPSTTVEWLWDRALEGAGGPDSAAPGPLPRPPPPGAGTPDLGGAAPSR